MATRTCSHTVESSETFAQQNLLKNPEKEVCAFNNADIAALRASGAFPDKAIIRSFDRSVRSDVSSREWICFPSYPFSLGLRYPFPKFMINPLVLKATKNEDGWQRKFFFVKRDSIVEGNSLPVKWLTTELAPPTEESERRIQAVYQLPETDRSFSSHLPTSSQYSSSDMSVFDLDELDSYSGPVQVKKEPSPKAATSSKPTDSKPTAIPKPSSANRTRASSTRKRKETDSPATSEIFPYENHGFVEASGFMTSFLIQGLERLVHLYEESCGLNKMLEVKLKKAEVTITDQGMIATAKSQHYEDRFMAMTQEHQAGMMKAAHEAQEKLDAAQTQHEQDMPLIGKASRPLSSPPSSRLD
ncbi:hypothetical protein Hanom_Chr08g00700921 [Helianthus anomalus]